MQKRLSSILTVFGITILFCGSLLGQQSDNAKLQQLGQSLSNQASLGQYDHAITIATKMLELRPDQPGLYMIRGEMNYMAGNMDQAVADFDKVIELDPRVKPRLWQRGLALYYQGKFEEGAEQFEVHRTVNGQDVENAVWHFACIARHAGFDEARNQLMEIERDTRVPMMQIHQLFAGTATPEDVLKAAAQGTDDRDIARNKFYAHFYIGLFFEAKGDADKSLDSMKKSATGDNYMPKQSLMSQVANVHLKMRAKKETNQKED